MNEQPKWLGLNKESYEIMFVRIPIFWLAYFVDKSQLGLLCKGSLVIKVEDQRPFQDLKGQVRQRYNFSCLIFLEEI